MPPSRRIEDRIRSVCAQILAGNDGEDITPLIVELRQALHEYVQRLRNKVAESPVTIERRNRSDKSSQPPAA